MQPGDGEVIETLQVHFRDNEGRSGLAGEAPDAASNLEVAAALWWWHRSQIPGQRLPAEAIGNAIDVVVQTNIFVGVKCSES